jgi:hypothetical protein
VAEWIEAFSRLDSISRNSFAITVRFDAFLETNPIVGIASEYVFIRADAFPTPIFRRRRASIMTHSDKPAIDETEEELVTKAQTALSRCNWTVGECAYKWTQKYAKGRTDNDFGTLVGMSGDQIYQRRRVWETFGDVTENYPSLKWSHFYVASNWDDAPESLQWANENETTVAEMKAWRRAVRGEDLTEEAGPDDWGGDPAISFLPTNLTQVREPGSSEGTSSTEQSERSGSAGDRDLVETVAGVARGSDGGEADYTPFRQGASSPPPDAGGESVGVAVAAKPQVSADQLLNRATKTLERINNAITPETVKEFRKLPEKLRNRFLKALSELNSKTSGL